MHGSMRAAKAVTREQAAKACVEVLDTTFFKALCEPARVSLLREIVLNGRADVGTIAASAPQDRSVVARHLQVMERAGLLRSSTEGRNTFYDIDANAILGRLEQMTTLIRAVSAVCCPPNSP